MSWWRTTETPKPGNYDPNFPYQNPSYIRDAGNEYFGWCKVCVECDHSWSPQLTEHHKEDCSHYEDN